MSITVFDNSGVEDGGGGGCMIGMSIVESPPEIFHGGDRRFVGGDKVIKEKREERDPDSCSCSSIGNNSDDDDDTEEVQSFQKINNGALDGIQALEEALPISRRGISRFYNGKSKSFTSLADASSSSSIKHIAKPENAYTRKRRNLLACSLVWDKNRSNGISKRLANSSRTSLALAVAAASGTQSNSTSPNSNSNPPQLTQSHCDGAPSSSSTPPRNFSAWRSFSLADLQNCAFLTVPGPQ